jgi:hypothetical protein
LNSKSILFRTALIYSFQRFSSASVSLLITDIYDDSITTFEVGWYLILFSLREQLEPVYLLDDELWSLSLIGSEQH